MKYYHRRQFNKDLLPKTYNIEQIEQLEKDNVLKKDIRKYGANIPISMMNDICKFDFQSKNEGINTLVSFCLQRETNIKENYYTGPFKVFTGYMKSSIFVQLLYRKARNESMRMVMTKLITKEAVQEYARYCKVIEQTGKP